MQSHGEINITLRVTNVCFRRGFAFGLPREWRYRGDGDRAAVGTAVLS